MSAHYARRIAIELPDYPTALSTAKTSTIVCSREIATSACEGGRLGRRWRRFDVNVYTGHTRPAWPSPFSRRAAALRAEILLI
jgi:hypothetical protein